MPITEEQLNAIKAANHAKSKAWEEERFLTGDRVVLYQRYYAKRLATNSWLDEQSNTEFETLSRWVRHTLNRPSATIKQYAIMLAYPGVTRGTYKLINYLPTKDKREPHMLPLTSCSSSAVAAPAPAPALKVETPPAHQLSEETIKDVVKDMINWVFKYNNNTLESLQSAGIGELVDFLTANKETVIAAMKKDILWHMTLNATMTAFRDMFIDNEDYEDVVDEQVNEYYDNFTGFY